ncbi:MAG: hypothetical protein AAB285_02735 [candidate division NC10 bacterium]
MPCPSKQRKHGKKCYDSEINRFAENKIIEELNEELNEEEDEEEAFEEDIDLHDIREKINPSTLKYKEGAEKYIRFPYIII